jgi:hypothetical protein
VKSACVGDRLASEEAPHGLRVARCKRGDLVERDPSVLEQEREDPTVER